MKPFMYSKAIISPTQVCSLLVDNCGNFRDPLTDSWLLKMPGTKPPFVEKKAVPPGRPTMKVLHLTDLHIDKDYTVGSETQCSTQLALCCRPMEDPDIEYIILTGDLESHAVWDYTKEEHVERIKNVSSLIKSYFPTTEVYYAIGNHEGVPMDSFAPHYTPKEFHMAWLYDTVADSWSDSIPADQVGMVKYNGCYTKVLFPGLRIISLNTGYGDNANYFLLVNETDPDGSMSWFVQQLNELDLAGDKAVSEQDTENQVVLNETSAIEHDSKNRDRNDSVNSNDSDLQHLFNNPDSVIVNHELENYLTAIGFDEKRDIELIKTDKHLVSLTEECSDLDNFMLELTNIETELTELNQEWSRKMRSAKNVKISATAIEYYNTLHKILSNYMRTYRKYVGCCALHAKLEWTQARWVEVKEVLAFKTTRDQMVIHWRTVKSGLKEKGELGTDHADSLNSYGNTPDSRHLIVQEDTFNKSASSSRNRASLPRLVFPDETNLLPNSSKALERPTGNSLEQVGTILPGYNERAQGDVTRRTVLTTPRKTTTWEREKKASDFQIAQSRPNVEVSRNQRNDHEFEVSRETERNYREPTNENNTVVQGLSDLIQELRFDRRKHESRGHFSYLKTQHPKFGGEITEFHSWFTSYQEYIGNSNANNYIKLLQLKERLTGDAHRKVFGAGLQLSSEGYTLAINRLIDEYDDPERIERGYHERIDRISRPEIHDLSQIRAVYEELMMLITTMGCSPSNMGMKLKVEKKFPSELIIAVNKRQYERQDQGRESLQDFMQAIDREILARERVARINLSDELPVSQFKSRQIKRAVTHTIDNETVTSESEDEDTLEMSRELFAVYQNDKKRARIENKQNWGTLSSDEKKRARNYKILHICNFCDARQKRHFEHKCPKYPDFDSKNRKVKQDKRCIRCFEIEHKGEDICPRESLKCLIEQCFEGHGLAVCPKYHDFVNENNGNFSLRKLPQTRK